MKIRGLSPITIARLMRQPRWKCEEKQHVFICIADHYEPKWNRATPTVARERVKRWVDGYPRMAQGIFDSRGQHPQHTFFYPQDEYEPELVEPIVEVCRRGYGDLEIHLHHGIEEPDTADGLREKLISFRDALAHEHGMLRRDRAGNLQYAFIHGNWALNNSRADGRYCGVNNELSVLMETGCYADMTMPSAPADCQTSAINKIYYARDVPGRPKSHDQGPAATVGQERPHDCLLMIQGPLALDWSKRKWGVLPGIENGDLTGKRPPTLERLALWLQAGVKVAGKPNWAFLKLHTHGAQEANAAMFLDGLMRQFHRSLATYAERSESFCFYYVTAFEMAALIRQAEQGYEEPEFSEIAMASARQGCCC